jgi:TP901 family phage tail tape measure protein
MSKAAQATGAFNVQQVAVSSQADEFTRLLAQNKLGITKYGASISGLKKTFAALRAEQVALNQTVIQSYGTDAQGRTLANAFSPKPIAAFSSEVMSARNQLGLFGAVLKDQGIGIINWGKNMQWAGRQLTVGLSVPMAAVGAIAGVMAFKVNEAMTNVQKVYDTTATTTAGKAAELGKLSADSFDMAKNAAEAYGASITDTIAVEAKFAAIGARGNELLAKSTEVMRFATLGDFDFNTAMTASIALSSIFKMNAKQLTEAINYMNAAENATVLSMEDFAVAIPIAAGPVKLMGGNIKTLGILMTAMKSQGISAAQGANAIKSSMSRLYRPSKQVQDEFETLTGQSLPALIKNSNGIIDIFGKISDSIQGLQKEEKIKVLAGIFGTYQVTRLTAIMKGLQDIGDTATQTGKAAQVAGQSVQTNAQIAARELELWQKSISAKFKIALQTLKADLAEIGPMFVKAATVILDIITKIAENFNNLPSGVKWMAVVSAGMLALAGPLLMITGLIGNLFGQAMRLSGGFLELVTRFKLIERDSMLATKLREITSQEDALTAATISLTEAQIAMAASFREASVASGLVKSHALPYNAVTEASIIGPAGRHVLYNPETVAASDKIAKNTAETSTAMKGVVSGATMGAGMIGLMATASGSWQNNMFLGITALGLFPGLISKVVELFVAGSVAIKGWALALAGQRMTSALSGISTAIAGIGTTGALAFAAVAVAGVAAWYEVNKAIEKAKATQEALDKSTQNYAQNFLGLTAPTTPMFMANGQNVIPGVPNQSDIDKAVNFITESETQLRDKMVQLGQDGGDAWGEAIYSGLQLKLSGASNKQVVDRVAALMQIAGKTVSRHKIEAHLGVIFDKNDKRAAARTIDELTSFTTERLTAAMQNQGDVSWTESIWRATGGDSSQLSASASQAVQDQANQFWSNLIAANKLGNNKLQVSLVTSLRSSYLKPFEDIYKQAKEMDGLKPGTTIGDLMAGKGLTGDGMILQQALGQARDGMDNLTQGLEAANPQLRKFLENNMSIVDALYKVGAVSQAAYLKVKTAMGQGGQIDYMAMAQGNNVAIAAMDGYGNAAVDAVPKIDKNTAAIKTNQAAMKAYNGVDWKSTWQTVMTDAQQSISDTLMSKFDQNMQSAIDAVAAAWQKKLDQFDAMRAAQEKKWEKKQTVLDNQQQHATDALTAQFDKRRNAITAYYDAQTANVNAAISAEQRAEEIRQKIFDNEEQRLQRLADSQNATIDFNMALNAGNLDEAAKIRNDQAAAEATNNLTDAADVADAKSQKRLDHLNTILDKIEKLKQKKLDALDKLEEKEKKMLEKEQQRQDEQLARERDHWEKMMDIRAKALQAQADAANKEAQAEWDARKESLQNQLDALLAFIPRNEEQLKKHADNLRALYNKFGGDMKISGKEWAKVIGDALHHNVSKAARGLKSDINWSHIGKQTAQDFLQGAFGMTRAQFMQFLGIQPKKKGGILSNIPNIFQGNFHSGGLVGEGGQTRAAGAPFAQDEVSAILKRKEFVMQESSVSKYGPGFMRALNEGKIEGLGAKEGVGAKDKKGGRGPGLKGDAIGLAFEGVVSQMMAQYMQGGAVAFISGIMQNLPGHFKAPHAGHFGDMDFDKGQLKIAALIASVGKGMNMGRRDILTGLATAITESTLHNYAGGSGSSIGVFQQTDPWGPAAKRHDPAWASKKFFQSLKQVDNRGSMSIGQAAQAVQRSAYPGRYQTHVDEARAILAAMAYHPGATGSTANATPRGQRAIDWATNQVYHGGPDWYRLCLQFVRSAFGVGPRDKNATTGWLNAKYKHRQTPGAAPPGVPLWWGGGDGHVALSLGHGRIISTDIKRHGHADFAKAADVTHGWGKPYYGWSEDINGVKIYKHNAPGLLKGGTIRYDNTMINAHKNEKVLTAPLSKSLETGIQRMETHGGDTFNIEINVAPGEPVDENRLARNMMKAIKKEQARVGYDRWIK